MMRTRSPRSASSFSFGEARPLIKSTFRDNGSSEKQGKSSLPATTLSKTSKHLYYHEIPTWQQENEYVLSGYRSTSGSLLGSLNSLLWFHNETISIWTHLLGSLLFALLPYQFFVTTYQERPRARSADLIAFTVYCFGVAMCFALSATCHIIWNHSPLYASRGNRFDYLGIVVLMWGASVPTIYYGFTCDAHLQFSYLTLMTIIAAACAVATMDSRFAHPTFRPYRAALYACLGMSWIVFVAHGIILRGWATQLSRMSLNWVGLVAFLDVAGGAVYAARIPERWRPYTFDFVGQSHQIFHVLIILAALAHLVGVYRAFGVVRSAAHVCA